MGDGMKKLAELAATQFGAFARYQLEECMVTTHRVRRRVEAGALERARYRGIYRFPGSPQSWHSRAMELLLSCGPGSALSHHTAAHLHGLDGFDEQPTVLDVLKPGASPLEAPPHRIHRSRSSKLHAVTIDGLSTTSVVRTLVDLGDLLTPAAFEQTFDSARRRHKNLEPWFTQYAERQDTRFRRSVATIKQLFAARDGFDSRFEVQFRQVLEAEGFPQPNFHYTVFHERKAIMEVDAVYLRPNGRNIALHCDGFAVHSRREQFERDAAQRTQLSVLGWVQLFVTYRALHTQLWKTALRTALAA